MNRFTALLLLIVVSNLTTAQTLTIDLGLGVNSPSDDFVTPYEAKPINGLTVDAGTADITIAADTKAMDGTITVS